MDTLERRLVYIEAPQGESPVELRELEVEAVITGLYAETTQTMVFFNPNQRALEGSLTFPLPEGAVVCGYALDVDGRMVDGVIVPKQEARRILEAEIRKGVDPGLIEQVAGNLYRSRIYPLPPRGTRRVRITYVQELTCQDASAFYHLPITHSESLQEVKVRLEVRQAPVTPALSGVPEISLRAHQGSWVAEGEIPGSVPHDFHLELPDLPERFAQVERSPEGEIFFCVSAVDAIADFEENWRPRRLAVVWDASGSRLGCENELELLAGLAELWPHAAADLVVLRQVAEAPLAFPSLAALRDHLLQLPIDGATALSDLDLTRPPHPDCEAWLLFSDGLDTVNPGLPKLGALPVIAITGQVVNNTAILQYLGQATQGQMVNLTRTLWPQARDILSQRRRVAGMLCQGGEQVHQARWGGRIQALGRLTPGQPEALVTTGVLEALRVEATQAQPGRMLARAWAGKELVALQARGDEGATLNLGRRYGLVTPGASLLVLESLEQYLEYDVCPPETLPRMRQDFLQRREQQQQDKDNFRRNRLDEVSELWAERVQWWETDFRPRWEEFRQPKPVSQEGLSRSTIGGFGAPGAPPPAPMMAASFAAPAPMPAVSMGASMDLDEAPCCEMAMMCEPSLDLDCLEFERDDASCMAAAPLDYGPPEGGAEPAEESQSGPMSGGPERESQPSISIRAWDPDTPYLRAMRESGPERAYETYLRHRPEYANSPSFFLDCADYLLTQGQRELGVRVLSNLLEMGLDDASLMRMVAWRLQQEGLLEEALLILERVLRMRADEPQSYRDLGLALGERWEKAADPADAWRAAELLYEVVQRRWDRFPEIEIIALMELNRLLARANQAGVAMPTIDFRLHKLLDLDLRISMAWDADLTDVDLHVHEPTGEHAYYAQSNTRIGGRVSRDFREGYGPEEYALRRAYPGEYQIQAHYYGSHQQTLTGACTVLVSVYTNYGRPHEEKKMLTLRLDKPSSTETVGSVKI